DDGNPGEQHEFRQWNSRRCQWATRTLNRSGHFAFRKDETAARLIRDDGADFLVLDCRTPAKAAAVRMRVENPRPDLVEERRYSTGHHITIKRACGWGHLAEVLIQRLGVARKLHAGEKLGPNTEAKSAKPSLLVGRRRKCNRLRAATGITAPQINKIDPE